MSDFDIKNLRNAETELFVCSRCGGIHTKQIIRQNIKEDELSIFVCPLCGEYEYGRRDEQYDVEFLRNFYRFQDLFYHGRSLALGGMIIMGQVDPENVVKSAFGRSTLSTLITLIANARYFIHFMSLRISEQFLGALKSAASNGVQIKGVISGLNNNKTYDKVLITEIMTPDFYNFETFVAPNNWGSGSHSKLIVIDGLLAIHGSANLTNNAWRNVEQAREIPTVEFNTANVIEMNNKYFSPMYESLQPHEANWTPF